MKHEKNNYCPNCQDLQQAVYMADQHLNGGDDQHLNGGDDQHLTAEQLTQLRKLLARLANREGG